MNLQHIHSIQVVAQGLEELREMVVFVGGAVAELYATDHAAEESRISEDIDCVIEIGTRTEYHELEQLLETKGFQHDTSRGAPICRWNYKNILVDIMPTKDDILGFSNSWYQAGINSRIEYCLPDGTHIYIFPPEIYLASKLEAFYSRGPDDLRQSHDFEDIIYILNNNPDILNILRSSANPVKKYLHEQFQVIRARTDILEFE